MDNLIRIHLYTLDSRKTHTPWYSRLQLWIMNKIWDSPYYHCNFEFRGWTYDTCLMRGLRMASVEQIETTYGRPEVTLVIPARCSLRVKGEINRQYADCYFECWPSLIAALSRRVSYSHPYNCVTSCVLLLRAAGYRIRPTRLAISELVKEIQYVIEPD